MSVLKRSLFLLHSFKQSHFSHQSSFPHIAMFFFFRVLCCRINTDFIRKTFRLDEGLALSFSFLLKAGFEGEIVQRSKMYTSDSLLLT